jgi:hypothetical protein
VYLIVLDPLIAPATVSSTIDIVVEVSGAEDLEFAVPAAQSHMKVIQPYQYQSGILVDEKVGGSKNVENAIAHSEICVGEKVLSIRQLLKRIDYFSAGTVSSANSGLKVFPFNNGVKAWTGAETYYSTDCDLISLWSHCYAVSRGGVRIRAAMDAAASRPTAVFLRKTCNQTYYLSAVDTAETYDNIVARSYQLPVQRFRSDNNSIEFQVPQYTRTYSRTVADHSVSGDVSSVRETETAENCGIIAELCIGNGSAVMLWRSAADDFSLGRFVSVPPVVETPRESL